MTNLDYVELEDAVVERLESASLLAGRTFAVTSPFMDVNELTAPPLVLIGVHTEQRRVEGNPIGVPLTIKVDVTLHVMVVASWLRARGDVVGAHEMIATIKDQLMGWQPDIVDVKRPFVIVSSSIYDHDEDRRLLFWLSQWSTMVLVREPA